MCAKMIHATSISRGPERSHLPVQHGDRPETVVQDVADARVAPHQDGIGGGDVRGPVRLQPVERNAPPVGAADVGDRELVPGLQPVEVAPQRIRIRTVGEEPEGLLGFGIACSVAITSTVLSCSSRCARGRVGEPVVAERVRHHVGRHLPSTWSIRKNGCRGPTGGLQPAHPRHRDVGELADQPDHLELVVQPIGREDRHVVFGRRDPGHPLLLRGAAVGSQRPVRMIVSDDIPLESTPLSTVISGATPPGITVDSHCDITAGSAETSRLECSRRLTSSTAGSLGIATGVPLTGNYDTVGSVMKADPRAVDKAPGAGRPPRSAYRRCHTGRDRGSACRKSGIRT